jgi:hypothetical protein
MKISMASVLVGFLDYQLNVKDIGTRSNTALQVKPNSITHPTTAAAVALPFLMLSSPARDLSIIPPYTEKIAKAPDTIHSASETTLRGHQK